MAIWQPAGFFSPLWRAQCAIIFPHVQKVYNSKSKKSRFFFNCMEQQASEISRHVSLTMDVKFILEKQK
jgi:hypothetical protein